MGDRTDAQRSPSSSTILFCSDKEVSCSHPLYLPLHPSIKGDPNVVIALVGNKIGAVLPLLRNFIVLVREIEREKRGEKRGRRKRKGEREKREEREREKREEIISTVELSGLPA